MKKIIYILLTCIILTTAIFAFTVSAETADDNYVWLIKHQNGETEFSDKFTAAINTAQDGDSLKLLKDYIEIPDAAFVTGDKTVNIDFGSSKMYYTRTFTQQEAGHQMLNVTGGAKLNITANGATVILQPQTRSYIQVSNNSQLTIDGGENKFEVHAPCAVNADGTSNIHIKNCIFEKNGGNMMGLLGVRSNSKALVENTKLLAVESRNALYIHGTSTVTFKNGIILSKDKSKNINLANEGCTLTFEGNNYLFGNVSGPGKITVKAGTFATFPLNNYAEKDLIASSGEYQKNIETRYFKSDGTVEKETANYLFTNMVRNSYVEDETQNENSIWKISDSKGEVSGYTSSFFEVFEKCKSGSTLTLLKDYKVEEFLRANIQNDLTVNLDGHKITSKNEGSTEINYVFDFVGKSSGITFILDNSVIDCQQNGFLKIKGANSVNVSMTNTKVFAQNFIKSENESITITDGFINSDGTIPTIDSKGPVKITGTTIFTSDKDKTLINAKSKVEITDSNLLNRHGMALNGEDEVTLSGNTNISGLLKAAQIKAQGNVKTDKRFEVEKFPYFYKGEDDNTKHKVYYIEGETLTEKELNFKHTFKIDIGDSPFYANININNILTLNIYIPRYMVLQEEGTSINISVNGVLYTMSKNNGKLRTHNGEEYLVFAYPYIYSNELQSSGKAEIRNTSTTVTHIFNMQDLIKSSLEAIKDDENSTRVAVAYLNYALDLNPDISRELLKDYENYLPEKYNVIKNEELQKLIKNIVFDATEERIYFESDNKTLTFAYKYGTKIFGEKDNDGKYFIRLHKFAYLEDIIFTYKENDTEKELKVKIQDLYSLVQNRTSYTEKAFSDYISFIVTLGKCTEKQK